MVRSENNNFALLELGGDRDLKTDINCRSVGIFYPSDMKSWDEGTYRLDPGFSFMAVKKSFKKHQGVWDTHSYSQFRGPRMFDKKYDATWRGLFGWVTAYSAKYPHYYLTGANCQKFATLLSNKLAHKSAFRKQPYSLCVYPFEKAGFGLYRASKASSAWSRSDAYSVVEAQEVDEDQIFIDEIKPQIYTNEEVKDIDEETDEGEMHDRVVPSLVRHAGGLGILGHSESYNDEQRTTSPTGGNVQDLEFLVSRLEERIDDLME